MALTRFKLENGIGEKPELLSTQNGTEISSLSGSTNSGLKELAKLHFAPDAKPYFEHQTSLPLLQSTNTAILNRLKNINKSTTKKNGNNDPDIHNGKLFITLQTADGEKEPTLTSERKGWEFMNASLKTIVSLLGLSLKDVCSQGGGGLSSADILRTGSCGRAPFWCKKLQIFRNLWCFRMDKEGRGVEPVRT